MQGVSIYHGQSSDVCLCGQGAMMSVLRPRKEFSNWIRGELCVEGVLCSDECRLNIILKEDRQGSTRNECVRRKVE